MCNPRKIRIQVAETIREAWRETLTQTEVYEDRIIHCERCRTPITLDRTLGPPALATLDEMIRQQWQRTPQGEYCYELPQHPQVAIYYLPEEHCFETRAWGTEALRVSASAHAEVDLQIDQEIEVTGEGTYYTDWEGHGLEYGQQMAAKNAEQRIQHQRRHWRDREVARAQQQHQQRLQQQALQQAQQQSQQQRILISRRLQNEVRERLQNSLSTACATIAQFLPGVYIATLKKIAQNSGGRVVCEQQHSERMHECTITLPNFGRC